jgi:outer membrane cobalamin receptor
MFRVIAGFVLAVLLSAASVFAQGTVAITGTVKDISGGVLPGATVNVVVADRVVATTTTGSDGRYQVQAPAGVPLKLHVHLEGFADQAIEGSGAVRPIARDVTMQIGRVSDTLVVTASRGAESRASVTQSMTVATAADIEALGSKSLADVLKTIPGLNVESTGREGAQTSVFSRGGESDYNLVLIDGVRVNQSGGAFDFSRIAAGEIERVEVVRGAQSALYGSDAMGAVVQIITKRAAASDAPRVSGSLEAGSFSSFRGDARITGGARQRVDYVAGVAARQSDGAFADILPEDDRFEQAAFDAAVGATLGSRASIRSGLRYSNSQGRSVGQMAYGVRNTGSSYDTKDFSWHLNLHHTAGTRYSGVGTINYFRADNVSADTVGDPTFNVFTVLQGTPGALFPDSPRLVRLVTQAEYASLLANPSSLASGQFLASTPFGVSNFPFTSRTQFRRPAFKYSGDVMWGGTQRLSAGYEWERETNALVPEQALTNNAVFVQQQFNIGDRWFAAVGGRVDNKSMYDTFFSPKLSAGGYPLRVTTGAVSSVKVFGNIGKGIKSPTFSERFGGSFADPSPGLKVERARSMDIGVEATFADQLLRANAVLFHNQYRDQIEFRSTSPSFSPDGLPDFTNIAGSNAHGFELEAALQRPVAGVTAAATYAYVDTEVIDTRSTGVQFQPGQPLLRRPKNSGMIRVNFERSRLALHWDTRVVGERHDSAFLGLRSAAGVSTDITVNPRYTVSGFGAEYKAHEMVSVYFRADNIADEEYESALGFPGQPRSAAVGLRFNVGR